MASPPTSAAVPQIPETPVSKGWLRVVRIATLVLLTPVGLCILLASIGLFPFGLLLGGAFALYAWWLFSRLFGAKVKEGLAGAVGAGGAIVMIAVIIGLLIIDQTQEKIWQAWAAASLTVLLSGILPAAAIRTYYTTRREPGDGRILAKGLVRGALFLFILFTPMAIAIPSFLRNPIAANQASAVSSLRTINTAEVTYASTYDHGFTPSLAALGPPPGNAQPSVSAAGLIDSVLAGGVKSHYRFTYMPGPPDKVGHVATYTVSARPLKYGRNGQNSYFTDESGVIRQTSEDRPATAKDPPIGA